MPKQTQGRRLKAQAAKPSTAESAVVMVARLRRINAIEQVAISIKGVAHRKQQRELIDRFVRTRDAEVASPELAAFARKLLAVYEERQVAADHIAYWARFETRTVTDAATFEDRTRESKARLVEIDRGLASLEECAAPEVYGQLDNLLRTLGIGAGATSMDKPVQPWLDSLPSADSLPRSRETRKLIRDGIAKGESKKALAKRLGVDRGTIYHYLNDEPLQPPSQRKPSPSPRGR